MTTVVDFSSARPNLAGLVADGHVGVVRYLGSDLPRCITNSERQSIQQAGLELAVVFETFESRPLGGTAAGAADAVSANFFADEIGWPSDRPLYVAVDFEPTQEQLVGPVRSYFVALKAASPRPIRPYGCDRVLDYLCGSVGISDRGWQCVAWSYSRISPFVAILQHYPPIMNGACDLDRVYMADWGQWHAPDGSVTIDPIGSGSPMVLEGTVVEVQRLLTIISEHNHDPALDPGPVDGLWGPDTAKAVLAFQKTAKTPLGDPVGADGIVGIETMTALRILAYVALCDDLPPAPPPTFPGGLYGTPELHPAAPLTSSQPVVQRIQRRLCELGLPVGPAGCDGIFGLATNHAVTFFQEHEGLFVDGMVGAETWAVLFA